jgi:diphthamide synthase (EF-2-diphthine--ammonia ligase)
MRDERTQSAEFLTRVKSHADSDTVKNGDIKKDNHNRRKQIHAHRIGRWTLRE